MKKGRLLANAYLVLVFGFLYVPIAVLIAFSFNESKSRRKSYNNRRWKDNKG